MDREELGILLYEKDEMIRILRDENQQKDERWEALKQYIIDRRIYIEKENIKPVNNSLIDRGGLNLVYSEIIKIREKIAKLEAKK